MESLISSHSDVFIVNMFIQEEVEAFTSLEGLCEWYNGISYVQIEPEMKLELGDIKSAIEESGRFSNTDVTITKSILNP